MAKPIVDVSVIVIKKDERKVLLGQRKKSRENRKGYRIWEFPGGALKLGESLEHCGLRETKQETGLDVELVQEYPVPYTNDIYRKGNYMKTKAHEVTFYFRAYYINGEPKINGKEKKIFKRWEWFSWDEMPDKLSTSLRNLIDLKYNPFQDLE